MRLIDTSDPAHPFITGEYLIDQDTTVDELLNPDTSNPDFKTKRALWSYPIIKDGLIYVIDIRNGLFILHYTGRHSDEVQLNFLEGNSNLGDALDLDQNQQ